MVNGRDKVEKLLEEYGRERIIERIDYHKMPVTTELDLHIYLNKQETAMHPHTTPSVSPSTTSIRCPHCRE